MNKESPKADAPVPLEGTEQALEQAATQQPPPQPEQSSVLDTVGSVVEGAMDVADAAGTVFDIFG
jgi:hypothetical protein